jgi:predicted transport protein
MALDPKAMGEAIARNMKSKTGKTLEEWVKIVKKSKLIDKKEVIQFLKKEKGLGHFQAQRVFEELKGINEYGNREDFITILFQNSKTKKIYKKIESSIKKIGKDITVKPCKTYIPFYRKNQFVIVYPTKNDEVVIGLNLSEVFSHDRFKKGKTKGSQRINFKATINNVKEVDASILSAIQEAYNNN